MHQTLEEQVRALARPLWESAARPFGMAMDFWLMAEQMVLEAMSVTTRLQSAMLSEAPLPTAEDPVGAPVAQIRALAECMWDAAGRQYEMSQDFWLAAEKHVLAMVRATANDHGNASVQEICSLPPAAYLERIRISAYTMWEATGRQYGRAMEFWLAAERQALASLRGANAAEPKSPTAETTTPGDKPADSAADKVAMPEAVADVAVETAIDTVTVEEREPEAVPPTPPPAAATVSPQANAGDGMIATAPAAEPVTEAGPTNKRKRKSSTKAKRPAVEKAAGNEHV
ncbi:DUF2934 domain-containing protein [Defluviicoccus vanus]|uniref:DUF2934 domain-containing protein n=1 Tax=Defluviicoccus vanus TaxID=111831 RepID=A0A7H1N6G6_9PROT|nr:DUF2934 domain-containing protein [Defluviicoccus vanus]QNT71302.1 DUF2934 domain-containing protein [Defluviicoccus vanus]